MSAPASRIAWAPDWASAWGEDEYGLFADFEYKGVVQRMRWIAPGRFQMGSPEDEPERSDTELRHKVDLTQGFWLADTACTQALWEAVMDQNRSRFNEGGPDDRFRPVEKVSWDDCQTFLHQLNGDVPGLDLRLPTEAEWEYACRAGTTTLFSFGENITPGRVNYDGNFPCAGGQKGEYRAKTVPVKSLPANPWGLFEMHGNVDEWCVDEYAPYEPGPAIDPCRRPAAAAWRYRVVRGGSWVSGAGSVRSAVRSRIRPGSRYDCLGFRFARGRPVQQA